MNKFEKYLKDNRNEIGNINVDPIIWQSVENELLRKDNLKIRNYLRYAVSVLVFIASAAIIKYGFIDPKSESEFSLYNYSQEFGNMENEFQTTIYYLSQQIENQEIPVSCKSDFNLLTNELEELDKHYKLYIRLIEQKGYNEDRGMMLLEYLSFKLDLLEKIQSEIIKINTFEKNKKNEDDKIKIYI